MRRSPPTFCLFVLTVTSTIAEEPKEPLAPPPLKAQLVTPFTIARGKITRVIVRGRTLDQITSVEASSVDVTATIIEKGEAKLPEGWKVEQLGDRQVTLDVAVAEAFAPDTVKLNLRSDSEAADIDLAIVPSEVLVDEKEPNRGFKDAQPLELGSTVVGTIGSNKDVDVYRIDQAATASTACIHIDIIARRHGSALDPILTVYDAHGFERARCDDSPAANTTAPHDAAVTLDAPSAETGCYYLVIQDAHDTGSATHHYQVSVYSD
ncbi:MAG: hypothetical protein O3C21_01305 [Verrucomicrobia bacterium]|nr:hypothetical protein [Verrucomicrobiota bacterium]